MTQPTDDASVPDLERERLIEFQTRPILNQLDRIEKTLNGVAKSLTTDEEPEPGTT